MVLGIVDDLPKKCGNMASTLILCLCILGLSGKTYKPVVRQKEHHEKCSAGSCASEDPSTGSD